MKRRRMLAYVGGAAVAVPLAASAQLRAMPVVGYVSNGSRDAFAPYVAAFLSGLNESGHVEGQKFAIEYRWVEGRFERHAVPAIYEWREFAEAGGLMSYGSSFTDTQRQVGRYVGAILKGAKPAELPIVQTVKVELVLNQKTANALDLSFPQSLSGRADEVIE